MAVPSGDYRVSIARSGSSHFVSGAYASNPHHWTESASYATVHVGAGNVNLSTMKPDPGHTISGVIKTATNQVVHSASVTLNGDGGSYQSTSTDAHGNFSFFGVGSGTHTIAESAGSSGQNVRSGYYRSGATGNWTANEGQATALSANANHAGIVIKPANGFSISGKITNSTHQGVQSIVTANGPTYGFAFTDASGNYVMNGLEAGNYTVEVSPGSTGTTHYRHGYYSKTAAGHFGATYTDASTIHVGP
jgi:Carboxypeptidase regulatory-like domain